MHADDRAVDNITHAGFEGCEQDSKQELAGSLYILGLTLTRERRQDDASNEFRTATELEPDRPR